MVAFQRTSTAWIIILILGTILLVLSHFARPFIYLNDDVDIYQSIGEAVWRSDDFLKSEYPPLTTALFALLHPPLLNVPFPDAWSAFLIVACLGATAWTAWKCSLREACIVLFSLLATMVLLGLDVTWGRYDLLVGILILLTWLAHRHARFAAAGFFLMLAAGLKLVPIVLLPFLYVSTPKTSRRMMALGTIAGALITLVLPLVVIGPIGMIENLFYMIMFHAERGVQAESTWSGLTILWEVLHGRHATMLFIFRSHQNVEVFSSASLFSLVLGLLGIVGVFLRRKTNGEIAPIFLSALSLLLAFSTVLSPQYFSWILPLLLTWSIIDLTSEKPARLIVPILCTGSAVAILTNVIYEPLYLNLVDRQDFLPTLVLNLRNGLIFVLAWLTCDAVSYNVPARR